MVKIFHTNLKNVTKQNNFHLISNLSPFRIFQINFGQNVPISFHMFRSGLEKPLNQNCILFKLNYFKLKFYLILTIYEYFKF
jgi:hypothetical protein